MAQIRAFQISACQIYRQKILTNTSTQIGSTEHGLR
jgi:hypothetical protein